MTKITEFNKDNLQQVHAAMKAALQGVEEQLGIKIDIGAIKFSADAFAANLSAVVAETFSDPYLQGVPAEYIKNFNKYRNFEGCLLRRITLSNGKFVVVGIHGRSKFVLKKEGEPNGKMSVIKFELGDRIYNELVNQ